MEADGRQLALVELAAAVRATGYAFTVVTPATHGIVNRRAGNEWSRDLRDIFGWSRPFRTPMLPAGLLALMEQAEAVAPFADGWRSLVRLATLGDALFLHSAYPTETADAVFFGPDSYRFVAALTAWLAASGAQPKRAVDIGCGAGPAAVSLALARPDMEVIAVDINARALEMAHANGALNGARNLTVSHSDLLEGVDGEFDLIVANPPYLIDPTERVYRHGGGALGAGLSLAIVESAIERLAPGGSLLLYTGVAIPATPVQLRGGGPWLAPGDDPFRAAVAQRLPGTGITWRYRELDPDVFGEELHAAAYHAVERIAAVVLVATRPE